MVTFSTTSAAVSSIFKFYHTRLPISTGFAPSADYNLPMMTLYLDEQLIMELLIDYFLLLGTAKVCALPYRRLRFLAGAVLGAAWSCASLLPGMGWLTLPVMRPVLAMGMTVIAFWGERRLLRCFGAFLGVSALFGGAVYAAGLLRVSQAGGGAGPLLRLDMRVLVLAFAVSWAAVSVLFRAGVKNASRHIRDVTVERGGRTVRLRALEDTGNSLMDPITGCAAFVAEAAAPRDLFPGPDGELLRGPPAEAALRIPGMRLIPYSGVGGGGLLLAFRPDRVTVDGQERGDLIAAVAAAPIGTDGAYEAVI